MVVLSTVVVGCGQAPTRTTPDETQETRGPSATVAALSGLEDTLWSFKSVACAEGTPKAFPANFASFLRFKDQTSDSKVVGIDFTYDETFAHGEPATNCERTVFRTLKETGSEFLSLEETGRMSIPQLPECFGTPDPKYPTTIEMKGRTIALHIHRADVCGGYESVWTYEPATPTVLTQQQMIRRYVAYLNLGDFDRVTSLFSSTGAFLEPFTYNRDNEPTRHEGHQAIKAWHEQSFGQLPWRALKAMAITQEAELSADAYVLEWEYMDPRRVSPLKGKTHFILAGGEIFEAQIEVDPTTVETESSE